MTVFLKMTIVGGVLFLLPLAIVLMLLGYALRWPRRWPRRSPKASTCSLETGRLGIVTLLRLWCWSGLSSPPDCRSHISGERIARWFENSLIGRLPQYQMVKSMAEGLARSKHQRYPAGPGQHRGPMAVRLSAGAAREWLAERIPPQAPTPMAGNVMFFPLTGYGRWASRWSKRCRHKAHRSRIRPGASWCRLEIANGPMIGSRAVTRGRKPPALGARIGAPNPCRSDVRASARSSGRRSRRSSARSRSWFPTTRRHGAPQKGFARGFPASP